MGSQTGADAILVFSENQEMLAELLGVARELASRRPGPLLAVVVEGADAEVVSAQALSHGVDEVLVVQTSARAAASDDEEIMAAALGAAIRQAAPATVLVGATRAGASVAARAAQMLQIPYASNCVALELDAGGNLCVERRMYGGRFVARQRLTGSPRLATVPPKRFTAAEPVERAHGSVRRISIDAPAPRMKRLGSTQRSRSADDVTKAETIVAAGRGVKRMEDLRELEQLAKALGGVLAGSRPLTGDVDWLPIDRRIGLSGQTVRPNLYVACGISGQIEHIVGMKGARTVVAINNDPKAPIHGEADYSVVADLYDIVPALQRACEAAKAKIS
jgi:electron transfer flavoprotein alpha subunit